MKALVRIKQFVFGRWLQNPAFVIITNSHSCPCSSIVRILNKIKPGNVYHFESIDVEDISYTKAFTRINRSSKVLFYAHGDQTKMACFFKDSVNGRNRHIYIPPSWWDQITLSNNHLVYFHVCFGASILSQNNTLRKKFDHWVSYDAPVQSFSSSNEAVSEINDNIIAGTAHYVKISRNSRALKSGIESVYKSTESTLYNLKSNSIPGHQQIIQMVGNNIRALRHSI